ncbi:4'-phosphopantetheinyl transferase family protein [Aestuariimicrobium sp. T2.26MG-19.2B]|uniref:4'-phosphopantetheinyl transferase family protein n=1 Tax=Aestuariimicrobium sp. T2.26MG-19.2B TaxID=3040679 RepID=UPI002477B52B|nr:hypothetical protein [Aestuariimicrobium sp. T2.26MG-19.2B]CAI9407523.1 hypothetical protein AESSP_01839 [Aestuariimicrobium sp. T2.26MG-19.2B]
MDTPLPPTSPPRDTTTHVWWTPLTLASIEQLDVLDEPERARLERIAPPADRARVMLGAALLRHAIAGLSGLAPDLVEVDRTCEECGRQHGRPVLVGQPWQASVSHSGLLTVVALCLEPIGIDVQRRTGGQRGAGGDGRVDVDGEVDVEDWVRREARFKSGLVAPSFVDLHPPAPGHVAILARSGNGPVVEHDGAELLRRRP